MYVNYTDELKDIVVDFVKSVTKKEFDLTHWSSCLNCNFCLISWNYIKNSINSLLVSYDVNKKVVILIN